MPYRPAVFLTWKELFDELPTHEEIWTFLRTCNRQNTAVLLARMATHLYIDRFRRDSAQTIQTQRYLIANFLDKEVLRRAEARIQGSVEYRLAFHLQQVLTLLKWTIVHSMAAGGIDPETGQESRWSLGRCLLKTNDLFLSKKMQSEIDADRRSPSAKKFMRLQLFLGIGNEINNPPVVTNAVIRSATIFEEIIKTIPVPIDLNSKLGETTGVTLDTYLDLTLGVLANYIGRSQEEFVKDPARAIIDPAKFLGNKIPAESAQRFWEMESTTIEELAVVLARENAIASRQDFTSFRMKPFLRLDNGNLICVNPGFLQEKLEIGLFWTIVNALQGDNRQSAFEVWGRVFEHYASQIIGASVSVGVETYFPHPNFKRKKHHHESFDGVLMFGRVCVVFECKGGFLPNAAKYGENLDAFVKAFDAKFAMGHGAGVEQLARKIGQIFAGRPADRRDLEGIDLSQIEVIVPVMVAQDSAVSSFFTIPWLAKTFRDAMRKQRLTRQVVLTSLLVIHIEELENLCAFGRAGKLALGECFLFGGKKGDPRQGHYFVFDDILLEFLNAKKIERLPSLATEQKFGDVLDRACVRLFGRTFESPPSGTGQR
jgi:hypothetical protein